LTVSDAASGKIIWLDEIYDGEIFFVEYFHSVNRSPVADVYGVADGGLFFAGTRFYSFGAGMPEENIFFCGDGSVFAECGAKMPHAAYASGYIAEQTLVFRGEKYSFGKFAAPGKIIKLAVKKIMPHKKILLQIFSHSLK